MGVSGWVAGGWACSAVAGQEFRQNSPVAAPALPPNPAAAEGHVPPLPLLSCIISFFPASSQAADLEAARRFHAASSLGASQRQQRQEGQQQQRQEGRQPGRQQQRQEPPVVVIQPDLCVQVAVREDCRENEERGEGAGRGGSGGGSGERDMPGSGPAAAAGAAAAEDLPPPSQREQQQQRLPMAMQRVALDFPGLSGTVLLLLPHQSGGWMVWGAATGAGRGSGSGQLQGPPPPMTSIEVLPLSAEEAAAAAAAGGGQEDDMAAQEGEAAEEPQQEQPQQQQEERQQHE